MYHLRYYVAAWLLLCVMGAAAPGIRAQQARLQVRTDTPVLRAGDLFTLTVRVAPLVTPVPQLFGTGLQLHFDAAAFTVKGVQRGALLAGFSVSDFDQNALEIKRLVRPTDDLDGNGQPDGQSYLAYSFTLLAGLADPVDADGEVVHIQMQAKAGLAPGSYAFELKATSLNDEAGAAVPLTLVHEGAEVSTTRRARRWAVRAGDPAVALAELDDLSLQFLALDAPAEVTAARSEALPGGTALPGDYEPAAVGSWTLEQTGATAFQARVCIPFSRIDNRLSDRSQLRLLKRGDATQPWEVLPTVLLPNAEAPVQVCADVTGFSEFVAAAPADVLPVELVAFDARTDGPAVVLRWHTASETNNAGFTVETRRGASPRWGASLRGAWQAVAFVAGHGTTTAAQAYTHRVDGLAPGRHRFRLKQVDYDGAFAYSPEVEVTVAAPEAFALLPGFPNPFNPVTTLTYSLPVAGPVRLQVFDLTGRAVALLVDGVQEAGVHTAVFDAGPLASGTYLCRLQAGSMVRTQVVTLMK